MEGYRRIGRWALWLYFLMTLVTAVIHQIAVVLLLAFLIQFAFDTDAPVWVLGGSVYVGCSLLLAAGRFRGFDLVIKAVVAALAVSTLVAAAIAAPRADLSTLSLSPMAATALPLGFILALVGFMPAPVEMSVWSSLWTLAKDRAVGQRSSVEMASLDFKIGYVGTAVLAFAFLLLGAVVMHGSGETFSAAGPAFSTQLVELYTSTLGEWTRVVVMVTVLTAIFSTTLVVIDGFPRAIDRCLPNIRGEDEPGRDFPIGRGYWVALVSFGVLNVLGLSLFNRNLTPMIDFATTFSFATAPILGYLNLRAVTSDDVPVEARPGRAMLAFSYLGLVLLAGTTVVYLVTRIAAY